MPLGVLCDKFQIRKRNLPKSGVLPSGFFGELLTITVYERRFPITPNTSMNVPLKCGRDIFYHVAMMTHFTLFASFSPI